MELEWVGAHNLPVHKMLDKHLDHSCRMQLAVLHRASEVVHTRRLSETKIHLDPQI